MSAPGRRRVTSYDVALAAGVSQSTVSRCFDDHSGISPATRARVTSLAADLGYTPNALARSLITRRSGMVGVIATNVTMRSNPDVIYAIGDALTRAGQRLLLITVDHDWPTADALRGAHEFPLDGVVSCVMLRDEDMRRFHHRGVALVLCNRLTDEPATDSVATDHAAAAREVADRLHRAGHRRFLCVGGPDGAPVSDARVHGFLGRLSELGLGAVALTWSDFSYAGGCAAVLAHVRGGAVAVDAVFCANDQLALGALDALRYDLGVAVPHQVSVVGFDDVPEASRPSYDLTTVRQDSEAMARTAIELLLARIAEPGRAVERRIVPATFVERRSARL